MPSQPPHPTPAPILPDPGDKETFSARKLAHMKWTNDSSPVWDEIGQTSYQNALEALEAANSSISARDESFDSRDKAMSARDQAIEAANSSISARDESFDSRDKAMSARDQAIEAKDQSIKAKDETIKAAIAANGDAIWERYYEPVTSNYRLRPSEYYPIDFLDMQGRGNILVSRVTNTSSSDYWSSVINVDQTIDLILEWKKYLIVSNDSSTRLFANQVYLLNSNKQYTIQLPKNPDKGQWIILMNPDGKWSNKNITLQLNSNESIRSGSKLIKGESIVFDSEIPSIRLIFIGDNTWVCG